MENAYPIARIIARKLLDYPRLKQVAPAIVEEIVADVFFRLELMLDENGYTQDIATLLSEDLVECEGCPMLVFPNSPGRQYDVEDGVTICRQCAESHPNGNP